MGCSPVITQLASAQPAPPPEAMPKALKPQPTKTPFTSGASPSMKLPSGVKLSGPLIICLTPAWASAGTRSIAWIMCGSKWSQFSSRSWNSNLSGMPSWPQAIGFSS